MTAPFRAAPAARFRAGPVALSSLAFLVVLLMALVEFGQVWYYPGGDRGIEVVRSYGGAFRLLLWLSAFACILTHLLTRGLGPMLVTLGPFLPFILWGAFVVFAWSVDPITGVRTLIFWSLAAGLAAAAGHELDDRTLAEGVALLFGAITAASLLLAAFKPEAAYTFYGDQLVVRGLFPHKNQLGWYCAVGLIWSVLARRDIRRLTLALVIPTLALGLAVAWSKTALATGAAAIGFALLSTLSARAMRDGARAALTLFLLTVVLAAVLALFAPFFIDTLGGDETLTGRTEVWRHYLSYFRSRPLTGYGTGIFSTTSQLNLEIGGSVPGYEGQNLHSPHNTYLGIAGEAGVLAVGFFLLAHLYLSFVAPYRGAAHWLRLSATLSFAIMFAGLTEMRDGYGPGVATVALLASRAAGLRKVRTYRRA